jgi:hypothetical protein
MMQRLAVMGEVDVRLEQGDSYDASKDLLYRLYLLFTIFGVIAAMIGLGVIYVQTKATKEAARAALLNAQALINSQRPWIAIRTKEPKTPDSFEFQAICLSGIPAKIIHSYADWQTVDRGKSLQPIYKIEMLQYPFLLAPPDGPRKIYDFSVESLKANVPLWKEIQELDKTLYFLGKVEYIDELSFDSAGKHVIHETRWCYGYIGGAIFRSGPPESNDYT